jgi:hypothetical protein
MPFDFPTFFRVVRLAYSERVSFRRFVGVTFLLALYLLFALNNAVFLALDNLFFPAYREVEIRTPVFIVGNARSGTTFIHRLMCGDTERFSYFKAYELFFPSIIQKKLIRAFARFDRRVLGGRIDRAITSWEDRALAEARKMHPVGLRAPEEDEFLMMLPFSSSVLCVMFPYVRQLQYLYYFDERPAAFRRKILRYYRGCVQRQIYLDGGDKILCSKNPVFVPKMASLAEAFPDAKFVYMVRRPDETIPSLLKMMQRQWRGLGADPGLIEDSLEFMKGQMVHTYLYGLERMDALAEGRGVIVRYTDLVADPKATIENVYRRLGFDVSPEYAAYLDEQMARAKGRSKEFFYDLDEFGMERGTVAADLSAVYQRFGWQP